MPSIDMKLPELKKYMGINPKPKDFNEKWKEFVELADKAPLNYKIVESSFKFPFGKAYDLTFDGIDGEKIYCKMLLPKSEKKVPGILEFHGYGGYSREWSNKLKYVANGMGVFSMDCRDQPGNSGKENYRRGNLVRGLEENTLEMYYVKTFLDGYRLSKIVMELKEIDNDKIVTLGGSQGGALAIAVGALNPKIKEIFSVYPFLSDYKRVWEMDLGESPYQELKDYFRYKDPLHEREEEIFTSLGYVDIQNFSSFIKNKVIMATGLMDRICPPSTQFAFYNKLQCEKKILIYPDFGHEDIIGLDDIIYQWSLKLL
ncbi:MAG: acetylxylan esterase [Cetobacterium sp.]|uniref:acetylxylan esterase n=1 Tax=Cetobacterium sp. TaxID=2071632 RepID=UPI003F404792